MIIRARKIPPHTRIRLLFQWQERKRNRDPDNVCAAKKFVLDALVKAGVIPNDGWENIHGFTDEFLVGTPGVEVSLREMGDIE